MYIVFSKIPVCFLRCLNGSRISALKLADYVPLQLDEWFYIIDHLQQIFKGFVSAAAFWQYKVSLIFLESSRDDDVIHSPVGKPGQQHCFGDRALIWFGFAFHMTMLAWSRNKLRGMVRGMVLCCCSPSLSRLNELCIQRCPSAHHCCTGLWFACLCPSCYFREVCECTAAVSELLRTPSGNDNCTSKIIIPFSSQTVTEPVESLHDLYRQ